MNKRKATKMIILHCSATKEGQDFKATDIRKWHRAQGWQDIGYHYVIDLDGTVEVGRNEQYIGAHCNGKNSISIGICYVGGLDSKGNPIDTRTQEQKTSMLKLVKELLDKYELTKNDVHCHNEFAKKACPCFNIGTFRKEFEYMFE